MLVSCLAGIIFALAQFSSASFMLQPQSTIEGRVTTPDNRPVSDVRVFLQTESYATLRSEITDGSGRFRFSNVSAGTYYVQVEPYGTDYERQSQRVEVNPFTSKRSDTGGFAGGGEMFRVDFTLRPPGGVRAAGPGGGFHQEVPDAARKEFSSAVKSIEKQDLATATASLKRAIEIFPDFYDALALLGDKYVESHDYTAAIPVLKHAVEVNKSGWRSHYSLGVALIESKQVADGIQAIQRSLEINPDSINANMRLGMALAQNEQTRPDAIKALVKVTQIDKGKMVPEAYYYLFALYDKSKQYREAADSLEAFLKTVPESEKEKRDKLKKMLEQERQKAANPPATN